MLGSHSTSVSRDKNHRYREIMERAGESNPFKQKLAEQLFQISFFQRLLLKMLEQNSNRSETAAIIRILLLSAYLLT